MVVSATTSIIVFATVDILAAPGHTKLVALWVIVKAPVNRNVLLIPAWEAVPKLVIPVVPVITI